MKVNPDIFKAYDIRGKYPKEINDTLAEWIGNATAQFLSGKKRGAFIVCRDVRNSSSSLAVSVIKGILLQGSRVLDAGVGTTPYFYFLMRTLKPDGGIMVTASHNPPEYNGFKIRGRGNKPIGLGTGLEKIHKLIRSNKVFRHNAVEEILQIDRTEEYIKTLKKSISFKNPVRAVVDAGGGSTALFLPRLLTGFPDLIYKPIFFEPDGAFRKHPPNPSLLEAQKFAQKELESGKFNFEVIFDGDGDRAVFLDGEGEFVNPEFVFGLFALEEIGSGKKKFVVPLDTSKGVIEVIQEAGGKIKYSKRGYRFVRDVMKKFGAELAVEKSGHFFFRELGCDDSALLAFLRLTQTLSRAQKSFSRLVIPFKRYASAGEINLSVKDRAGAVKKVEKFYKKSGAKISHLDGIKAEFKDWWFNLRPSNTEPVVRLVVEAKNKKLLEDRVDELKRLIR